jgi:hypothetical protein
MSSKKEGGFDVLLLYDRNGIQQNGGNACRFDKLYERIENGAPLCVVFNAPGWLLFAI